MFKIAFILYADDTTLNSTLDSFRNDTEETEEIQKSIISELKKVFKWLDVNKLCLKDYWVTAQIKIYFSQTSIAINI